MNQDILLISCQTKNLEQLQLALEQVQMTVTQIEDIENVIFTLKRHSPAFLLLDYAIENADHLLQEISKAIFFDPPPYILIADAFLNASDRAVAFDLGADACIAKPISPNEVVAMIRSVLRREHRIARLQTNRITSPIDYKDLNIDTLRHSVTMRGEQISLAPKEFDILCLLAENPGVVLSKETIYKKVWKEQHEFDVTRVTDNIRSLRQKLGLDSKDTDYIQTVHRIGYRFARVE